MKSIYLDYAAATPVDKRVLAVMRPFYDDMFQNPSATYMAARDIRVRLDTARQEIAGLLGAKPAEIIFTAGGTEANNLAIIGVAHAFPGSHIVTTALEHDSVLAPVSYVQSQGWLKTEVQPKANGLVDPQAILDAVTDKTILISVMYANNEIGTLQPISRIAEGLKLIRRQRQSAGNTLPLYFHTDACQAANYADLHVHRLGIDLMTLNGGKIYGPKQSGVLFAAAQVRLTPLIYGGGQEHGRRSGTENVAASIGFAEALRGAQAMRKAETTRLQALQTSFMRQVADKIPTASINGSIEHRLPNNIHITIPGADNERLLFALDEAGVQCATGSACSASKAESSHTLKAIGLSDEEARASLRFTMGRGTTESDVTRAVAVLAKLVA